MCVNQMKNLAHLLLFNLKEEGRPALQDDLQGEEILYAECNRYLNFRG